MRGEIRAAVILFAVVVLAVDWLGFLFGNAHRDMAFALSQIGFFILAHALYTKARH